MRGQPFLSVLLVAPAFLAAPKQPALPSQTQAPSPPGLLINEVMFDPEGQDSAGEWVEIYSTRALDIGGWSLEDNLGNSLGVLPAMLVPAYSVVVVFFRADIPWGYDGNPVDRSAAVALGLVPGDHLDNRSGGLRLRSRQNVIKDSVYWGIGNAPSGSGGNYFDLSYASGRPMVEGDSLGRPANPFDTYTGTLSDFERHGGANSNSATPGARNGVEVTGMTGLKFWVQTGANQIINNFGTTVAPGWFSITSSRIANSVYDYQPDFYTVTSDHTFVVEVWGLPTLLSGPVTATFSRDETPGSVGYTLTAVGVLQGPGYGLSIDHSEHAHGFHSNTVGVDTQTDVVYTEGGQHYGFSVAGTLSSSWVGQGRVLVRDDRIVSDYGGAGPKNSNAQRTVTRVSDGTYDSAFSLTRDRPIGPPPISQAGNQTILGDESFYVDTTTTANDSGEITGGVVTRMDRYVDGNFSLGLETGQTGSFGFTLVSGSPGHLPQSHDYRLDLPLARSGSPFPVSASVTGTTYIRQGKLLSEATGTFAYAGITVQTQEFFVDPILGDGFIPRGSGFIDRPPPPEPDPPAPEPPAGKEKSPGGFMGAVATCATAGAGMGTAAGGFIGGVVGAITGSAAGGVGAIPGAIAGAKAGGLGGGGVGAGGGAAVCGLMYLLDWW